MKFVRFVKNEKIEYGVLDDDFINVVQSIFHSPVYTGEQYALSDVQLLAPVMPGKLVCVGLNYRMHAKESGLSIPDEPLLFMCSPQAAIATGGTIHLDNYEDRIEYEAELGMIVAKPCKNVSRVDAKKYILGYTCANDVSNRNLQLKDGQFTRAKSFDTYKPLGPCIETNIDPNNVDIKLRQNKEVRQSSNTKDMIFSVEHIFEFVSAIMTLNPGDIIITGTPSGVDRMNKNDIIEVEIEGVGCLENYVA